MTLRELLAALPGARVDGAVDAEVRGLVLDSRRVGPGDVFFALPGVKHAWPKTAACWSPASPAIGIFAPNQWSSLC